VPFVRSKTVKGLLYNYLVESYREDGKPRQRVVAYLGEFSTVRAAYKHWAGEAKAGADAGIRKHAREMAKKLEPYL
jgi:hypothetical protein